MIYTQAEDQNFAAQKSIAASGKLYNRLGVEVKSHT